MFRAIRASLDSLQLLTKKKYLVTTAVGGFYDFITHTEMDKAQQYLDFVNIMSYDFKTEADTLSGHHTNLYSYTNAENEQSGDRCVREFIAAGVPPSKIVLGLAFYGRGFKLDPGDNRGLSEKILVTQRGGGFTRLKDSLINQQGYKRYWDRKQKPYLYNKDTKVFITYDDEKSIRLKCRYVRKNKLGGVMFWDTSTIPRVPAEYSAEVALRKTLRPCVKSSEVYYLKAELFFPSSCKSSLSHLSSGVSPMYMLLPISANMRPYFRLSK
jgi:chitinase